MIKNSILTSMLTLHITMDKVDIALRTGEKNIHTYPQYRVYLGIRIYRLAWKKYK